MLLVILVFIDPKTFEIPNSLSAKRRQDSKLVPNVLLIFSIATNIDSVLCLYSKVSYNNNGVSRP